MSRVFQERQAKFIASYLRLAATGELKARRIKTFEILEKCRVCPRACDVNRLKGELGECRTGLQAVVSSYHAHFGEEPPLVGRRGSGTIFFTHCNLACIYCQNYDISQLSQGVPVSPEQLAMMMFRLQEVGCHNINFVSPTHVVPQILAALEIAVEGGLNLPLVYNTGGYDSKATLRILDGIVDIYMPDMKYSDKNIAQELSGIKNYPAINRAAVDEMHRQVGDLVVDEGGVAQRGIILRHLVLPNGLAGTREVLQFLAQKISKNTYLNLMDQYRPCFKGCRHPLLNRRITPEEFEEALELALSYGLTRLDSRRFWSLL